MMRRTSPRALWLLTLSLVAGVASGCGSPTATNNLGIVQVERLSGNGQTGIVNQTLPIALLIQAVDVDDRPVSGATVTWTVSTNGGSVSSTSETTDATGEAAVLWTLGSELGTESVVASAGGVTATFLATAVAASATSR